MKGNLHCCFACCMIMAGIVHADLTLRFVPSGTTLTIPAISSAEGFRAAVPQLFDEFGCSWEWNTAARQLSCTTDSARYLFTQNNLFYQKNGGLHRMGIAPVRVGPALYLPFEVILDVAATSGLKKVQWDSTGKVLALERPSFSAEPGGPAVPGDKPVIKSAANSSISTIVIDPGHGGKDPGAIGPGGTREKEVVLAIALAVRDRLKRHKDIRVFLTREKDVFIPLGERTRMANERKADLFVSIHANATSGSRKKKETTKGYKVYFLSQAKNEEDKLAAMRENAVIQLEEKPQNYGALQNVLIDLAGNEYLRESQELCIFLDRQFETSLVKKVSRKDRGIGQANFWVLNGAYMPSILIETCFISNRSEERLLASRKFQEEMANAIYEALLSFKKKLDQDYE
ncbi:MAG: N-acetylmuramoyl-L-alanine amidase [Chitinispirillaceae bacterium]|nr:N-acetylmuramoyl-L-alanine amidase [Chitinispirillaceae bacterium]